MYSFLKNLFFKCKSLLETCAQIVIKFNNKIANYNSIIPFRYSLLLYFITSNVCYYPLDFLIDLVRSKCLYDLWDFQEIDLLFQIFPYIIGAFHTVILALIFLVEILRFYQSLYVWVSNTEFEIHEYVFLAIRTILIYVLFEYTKSYLLYSFLTNICQCFVLSHLTEDLLRNVMCDDPKEVLKRISNRDINTVEFLEWMAGSQKRLSLQRVDPEAIIERAFRGFQDSNLPKCDPTFSVYSVRTRKGYRFTLKYAYPALALYYNGKFVNAINVNQYMNERNIKSMELYQLFEALILEAYASGRFPR